MGIRVDAENEAVERAFQKSKPYLCRFVRKRDRFDERLRDMAYPVIHAVLRKYDVDPSSVECSKLIARSFRNLRIRHFRTETRRPDRLNISALHNVTSFEDTGLSAFRSLASADRTPLEIVISSETMSRVRSMLSERVREVFDFIMSHPVSLRQTTGALRQHTYPVTRAQIAVKFECTDRNVRDAYNEIRRAIIAEMGQEDVEAMLGRNLRLQTDMRGKVTVTLSTPGPVFGGDSDRE